MDKNIIIKNSSNDSTASLFNYICDQVTTNNDIELFIAKIFVNAVQSNLVSIDDLAKLLGINSKNISIE